MAGIRKKIDHKVHIQGSDGSLIEERHYALHVVNGDEIYNIPPLSDKFYNRGGYQLDLDQVPDVCKRHLKNKAVVAQAKDKKVGGFLGGLGKKTKEADPAPVVESEDSVNQDQGTDAGSADESPI